MIERGSRRRRPLVAIVAVGLGLAIAPVAFQMFTRAPKGGRMIEQFRPYMTTTKIDRFRGYLDEIGAADAAAKQLPAGAAAGTPAVADLHRQWPTIDDDMGNMLTTMRG